MLLSSIPLEEYTTAYGHMPLWRVSGAVASMQLWTVLPPPSRVPEQGLPGSCAYQRNRVTGYGCAFSFPVKTLHNNCPQFTSH